MTTNDTGPAAVPSLSADALAVAGTDPHVPVHPGDSGAKRGTHQPRGQR